MTYAYHVYELIDPRTNATKYVGFTSNVEYRYRCHCGDTSNSAKGRWTAELHAANLEPKLRVYVGCRTESDGRKAERDRIIQLLDRGATLFNKDPRWSAKRRKEQSARVKANWAKRRAQNDGDFFFSEEARTRMSGAAYARWHRDASGHFVSKG